MRGGEAQPRPDQATAPWHHPGQASRDSRPAPAGFDIRRSASGRRTPHIPRAGQRVSCIPAIRLSRPHPLMLRWALIFLVVAIIAAVCGFSGVAGAAAGMARILLFIFLVMRVVCVLADVGSSRPPE